MLKQRITGPSKVRRNMKRPGQLQITEPSEDQIPGSGALTGRNVDSRKTEEQAQSSAHGGRRAASLAAELRASEEPHSRGGLEHGELDWSHEKSEPQCFWKCSMEKWKEFRFRLPISWVQMQALQL